MKYRKLGSTDIDVSVICLGTMTWGEQNTQEEGFELMDFALEKGVTMGSYYRDIFQEFGISTRIVYYVDNQSSIILVHNGVRKPGDYSKTARRRINLLKEYFQDEKNKSTIEWMKTELMVADVLTKHLTSSDFIRHSKSLLREVND